MNQSIERTPLETRAIAIAAAVSIGLMYAAISGPLLKPLLDTDSIQGVPYLRSALTSLSDLVLMLGLLAVSVPRNPIIVLVNSGLAASVTRPIAWAAIIFLPAIALSFAVSKLAADVKAGEVVWTAIAGPISEELIFRGLAIGALIRYCGWHWLVACLWPAVFFGVGHTWQGSDWGSTAGVVGITAAGGLLFGWLYIRWSFNLWPPILLHVGMNSLWLFFDLGENAIGGWFGNALRIAIVITAIVSTIYLSSQLHSDKPLED